MVAEKFIHKVYLNSQYRKRDEKEKEVKNAKEDLEKCSRNIDLARKIARNIQDMDVPDEELVRYNNNERGVLDSDPVYVKLSEIVKGQLGCSEVGDCAYALRSKMYNRIMKEGEYNYLLKTSERGIIIDLRKKLDSEYRKAHSDGHYFDIVRFAFDWLGEMSKKVS